MNATVDQGLTNACSYSPQQRLAHRKGLLDGVEVRRVGHKAIPSAVMLAKSVVCFPRLHGTSQHARPWTSAPRTVQYVHVTLHKALKQTVADGLIPHNAAEAVKAPRPAKKEIQPLSNEQARAFLKAASEVGDRFEALYVLAVHCGLREGELLGLKWEDVDLDAGTLAVRRTLSETKEKGHVCEAPKNGKGRRVKPPAGATAALKHHRKPQLEERMRLAGLYEDHGLVFPNQTGKTMNAKNLTARSFKPLLKRAGLPHSVWLHDLRHTCATVLLSRGVHPKLVQRSSSGTRTSL